jgi:hypothetical protein
MQVKNKEERDNILEGLKLIKNSIFINFFNINTSSDRFSIQGKYWSSIKYAIPQTCGYINPRVGYIKQPYLIDKNPYFTFTDLTFTDKKLKDILDERAIELIKYAEKTNKKIVVCWSGGIDSTGVLVSLLKNSSPVFLKNIEIVMNIESIKEYPEFYSKVIENKFKIIDVKDFKIDNNFLKNNIILTGEPADCLFGPGHSAYQTLQDGRCNESYKKHLNEMFYNLETLFNQRFPDNDLRVTGQLKDFKKDQNKKSFFKWYIEKIIKNLEESPYKDHITSVTGFYWWHYWNCKWHYWLMMILFTCKKDHHTPLDKELVQEFVDYTFFNTKDFQNWSFSNINQFYTNDFKKSFKLLLRQYILDYTKDENYFYNKGKVHSSSINQILVKTSPIKRNQLFLVDQNCQIHDYDITFRQCLENTLSNY